MCAIHIQRRVERVHEGRGLKNDGLQLLGCLMQVLDVDEGWSQECISNYFHVVMRYAEGDHMLQQWPWNDQEDQRDLWPVHLSL